MSTAIAKVINDVDIPFPLPGSAVGFGANKFLLFDFISGGSAIAFGDPYTILPGRPHAGFHYATVGLRFPRAVRYTIGKISNTGVATVLNTGQLDTGFVTEQRLRPGALGFDLFPSLGTTLSTVFADDPLPIGDDTFLIQFVTTDHQPLNPNTTYLEGPTQDFLRWGVVPLSITDDDELVWGTPLILDAPTTRTGIDPTMSMVRLDDSHALLVKHTFITGTATTLWRVEHHRSTASIAASATTPWTYVWSVVALPGGVIIINIELPAADPTTFQVVDPDLTVRGPYSSGAPDSSSFFFVVAEGDHATMFFQSPDDPTGNLRGVPLYLDGAHDSVAISSFEWGVFAPLLIRDGYYLARSDWDSTSTAPDVLHHNVSGQLIDPPTLVVNEPAEVTSDSSDYRVFCVVGNRFVLRTWAGASLIAKGLVIDLVILPDLPLAITPNMSTGAPKANAVDFW